MRVTKIAAILAVCAGLASAAIASEVVHKVGKVTWHPKTYVNQELAVKGYVLVTKKGYVLLSDEAKGAVSAHDLPVDGKGYDTMKPGKLYLLHGKFVKGGLKASNGNVYHLELTEPPTAIK